MEKFGKGSGVSATEIWVERANKAGRRYLDRHLAKVLHKTFFRHELSNQGRFSSRVREPTRSRLITYPNQFRIGRLSQNKIFTMHKNRASLARSMVRLFISCLVANSSVFSSAWLCGRTCPGWLNSVKFINAFCSSTFRNGFGGSCQNSVVVGDPNLRLNLAPSVSFRNQPSIFLFDVWRHNISILFGYLILPYTYFLLLQSYAGLL